MTQLNVANASMVYKPEAFQAAGLYCGQIPESDSSRVKTLRR
jgi:hypothetical protein